MNMGSSKTKSQSQNKEKDALLKNPLVKQIAIEYLISCTRNPTVNAGIEEKWWAEYLKTQENK